MLSDSLHKIASLFRGQNSLHEASNPIFCEKYEIYFKTPSVEILMSKPKAYFLGKIGDNLYEQCQNVCSHKDSKNKRS